MNRTRPTSKQIEASQRLNDEKASQAEKAVKEAEKAMKSGSAVALLDLYDARISVVERDRDRAALRSDLLAARIEEAEQTIVRMTTAGRPASQIHAIEIELADLKAEHASPRHKTAIALARRTRQALRNEREHAARDQFPQIDQELRDRGASVRAGLAAIADAIAQARQEWAALERDWARVERAIGPTYRPRSQTQMPAFPIGAIDLSIGAWPGGGKQFDGSRDPIPQGAIVGVKFGDANSTAGFRERPARPLGLQPAPADDGTPDLEPEPAA